MATDEKVKDPAFLFYSSDFLTGVSDMTMEDRGRYITLLCMQHQKGHLSKRQIKTAIADISEFVMKKFSIDSDGLYYNKRLETEIIKREKHKRNQKNNIDKRWNKNTKTIPNSYQNEYQEDTKNIPLENEIDNDIKDIKKNISKGSKKRKIEKSDFEKAIDDFKVMRNKIGKPMTARAETMLRNKLQELASDDEPGKIKMLEQSILHCWQTVYPLKENGAQKAAEPHRVKYGTNLT